METNTHIGTYEKHHFLQKREKLKQDMITYVHILFMDFLAIQHSKHDQHIYIRFYAILMGKIIF